MMLIRTGIRRRPDAQLGQFIAVKSKVCKTCKMKFIPELPGALACSEPCAIAHAVSENGKARKVAAVKEKKADAVKRQGMKRMGELIAEAQTAFNLFIRTRDASQPCICCGKPFAPQQAGGSVDAGHYRSRGSAPHLRFDERNVHAQRKDCNRFDSGNVVGYRLGLIERIGLEAVEALECDQTPRKPTRDDLIALKATYTVKARALLKGQP